MSFYYWLSSALSFGYTCLMPLLIIAWMILKKNRERIIQFVSIANGWFCVYVILYSGYWIIYLFTAWYSENQYEGYSFPYEGKDVLKRLFMLMFISAVLQFGCFILFLFKRFRSNIYYSISSLFSLHAYPVLFYLLNYYWDLHPRSYVSFENPTHWWEHDLFHLLSYLLIIAATYYWKQKRKPVTHS